MSWYNKYKTAYDSQMANLRDLLKNGFDPYDYTYEVLAFLEKSGDPEEIFEGFDISEMEDYEIGELWIEKIATPSDIKDFEEDVAYNQNLDSSISPSSRHLKYEKVQTPGWLVHFTDDPWGIEKNGFAFGHSDMYSGLGLTTYKNDRKTEEGFNFAFPAFSRDAKKAAYDRKYGKHAVIFWGSGVNAYHVGDEENQIVFWGPSVNRSMIFPIVNRGDGWSVEDDTGRVLISNKDYLDAAGWVEQNWRMLQQTTDKNRR
jgi:hypothetical protein